MLIGLKNVLNDGKRDRRGRGCNELDPYTGRDKSISGAGNPIGGGVDGVLSEEHV